MNNGVYCAPHPFLAPGWLKVQPKTWSTPLSEKRRAVVTKASVQHKQLDDGVRARNQGAQETILGIKKARLTSIKSKAYGSVDASDPSNHCGAAWNLESLSLESTQSPLPISTKGFGLGANSIGILGSLLSKKADGIKNHSIVDVTITIVDTVKMTLSCLKRKGRTMFKNQRFCNDGRRQKSLTTPLKLQNGRKRIHLQILPRFKQTLSRTGEEGEKMRRQPTTTANATGAVMGPL